MRLRTLVVGLIAVGAGAGAGPVSAAELLRTDVTAGGAVERSCTERRPAGGDGYAHESTAVDTTNVQRSQLVRVSTPTNFEEATRTDPEGSYVVRVIDYAAAEPWSGSVTFGAGAPNEETWTLSCEQPEGTIRSARQVFVERGQRRSLDLRRDCSIRR
jgi:hypothetical protein